MYYFDVIAKKLMFNDNKGGGKELYTVIFSDSKDKCIALLKCEISQNSQDLKLFRNSNDTTSKSYKMN